MGGGGWRGGCKPLGGGERRQDPPTGPHQRDAPLSHLPHSRSLSLFPIAFAAPIDLAGQTITELELLEPTIQEAATDGKLAAALGAAEAKEVIAEAVSLEEEADALEVKMDATVGADTDALDAAAVPLKARVDQLARLVALVGGN